jgi:hypothetical protein
LTSRRGKQVIHEGLFHSWSTALYELCAGVRAAARAALATQDPRELARVAQQGVGDVTFGLDVGSELFLDHWFESQARAAPLSLLTEDRGWRHAGPDGHGAAQALAGFNHGGPRVAIDPIDGTRNLMADLRSAWTVVSFAGPGALEPRLADVCGGIVSEIPPTRQGNFRALWAGRTGPCRFVERDQAGVLQAERLLVVDADERPDRGYFPFFRYKPEHRQHLAALEAAFFTRLRDYEAADLRSCYDDQYISNAGQLVLLALGTYRMIVDARALVATRMGQPSVSSKPYDVAGAILCARAAGCVIHAADGRELDFPIDACTPVHFAGWTNPATCARLERHWLAVLAPSS